jgi:hypothetical protein
MIAATATPTQDKLAASQKQMNDLQAMVKELSSENADSKDTDIGIAAFHHKSNRIHKR